MAHNYKNKMIEVIPANENKDLVRVTPTQWDKFLTEIAGGRMLRDAVHLLNLNQVQFKALMAKDPQKRVVYEEARLERLRSYFGAYEIESICAAIAAGKTVRQAINESAWEDDPRVYDSKEKTFYALVLKDPEVRELYDEARMIQAEKMAMDDLLDISDDRSQDETWDGKPNSASVNRDRLRVDTRKWIAAKLHYKRFGDKVQQDVNANVVVDHAARLEEARKRAERATEMRKQRAQEK